MPRRKTPVAPIAPLPAVPVPAAKLSRRAAEGSSFRDDSTRPSSRPIWEYHTYTTDDGVFYLDALGVQGWELVTIYRTGDAMHAPIYYAVFKRQKE